MDRGGRKINFIDILPCGKVKREKERVARKQTTESEEEAISGFSRYYTQKRKRGEERKLLRTQTPFQLFILSTKNFCLSPSSVCLSEHFKV